VIKIGKNTSVKAWMSGKAKTVKGTVRGSNSANYRRNAKK